MMKKHLSRILLGLLLLSLLPIPVSHGIGTITITPTKSQYERGDSITVNINGLSLTDYDFILIQFTDPSGNPKWAVQLDDPLGVTTLAYLFKIPDNWVSGTWTIYVREGTTSAASKTFKLYVPSSGGGYVPPAFTLSSFSVSPTTVKPGEPVTVSVKVTNPAVISGSQTLKLKIDGVVEASEEVILPAGASKTVSWTVKKTTPKTYEVEVNGKTGSFEVEEEEEPPPPPPPPAPADFVVSNLVVSPKTVEPGETVTVSAKVTNVGGKSGSYTAELLVDGSKVDEETVTLDAGENTIVEFTVTKDVDGTYTVSVALLSDSFTVETPPPPPKPAEFVLSSLVVSPTTVEIGDPVTVSVTVTNVGEESGSYTAELLVDGSKVDEETVALDGGESERLEFVGVSGAEGSHTVSVGSLTGSFTVEAPEGGVGPNWALYAVGGLAILGLAWVVYNRFLQG